MKFNVTYKIVSGLYHVEFTLHGAFCGGGNSGCSSYEEAYNFASKVAASKGGIVGRFSQ